MKSFCQIVILSFVLLLGLWSCSSLPKKSIFEAKPTWFNLRKSIQLANWKGEVQPHLFYDTVPGLDSALSHVNFVPLALAHDDQAYALDHISGQRYFSHFYCRQTDAWKKRGSTPRKPTFTRGIVPRHFDQLHDPQQIIVFGEAKDYKLNKPEAYRVRIVGGVVEQICKAGRCSGPNDWMARLVLVAVNDHDRSFKDVTNIRQLQDEINWKDVQNQLENHDGHNVITGGVSPAVKVGNLLESKEVMDYLLKRSVILNSKELSDLNRQCGKLYWRLWRDVGRFTTADANLQNASDIKKKLALREELRKQRKPTTFHQLLSGFFKKEGDALATCSRLVYPADPGKDYERFWFTSWITQYVRLHLDGWLYSCSSQAWVTENVGKEAMEYLKTKTGECSDRGFDRAMTSMPLFLKNQRPISGELWRFVEWDNGAHGTHSKLYSWVHVPNRKISCNDEINERLRSRWQEQPEGESWLRRYRRSNSDKESDYIY